MPDPLHKYRTMRRFDRTPEPAGGKPTTGKLPIFVIQKHHATQLHYDFRLEMEGVLKSWSVPKGPSYDPSVKRLAMMTEDHPYDYAGFEGVIPAGNYGAGNVIIWDTGGWEFVEPGDDPVEALREGKLAFKLYGKKMFGEWALVRMKGHSPKGNEWLLLKHRDAWANADVDVTEVAPVSVVSGLDVDEIGTENVWISNRKAKTATKRTTKKAAAAPSRPRATPPREASAPTRSSPSRSPRKAGTTARRRPR